MAVFDSRQLSRLQRAVTWSRQRLGPFRDARVESIRQYVGARYGNQGASDKVPVNYIELAVTIYLSHLVTNNPAVLVSTPHMQLKTSAYELQLGMNHLVREINLVDSLQQVVTDALFSMGIIKLGLTVEGSPGVDGVTHDAGQAFADSVDLDNWVHDMSVSRWDHIGFCGDVYKLPLDLVKSCGLYQNVDGLTSEQGEPDPFGDGSDKAEDIGRGPAGEDEDFEDQVSLVDLWVPRHGVVVTLPWAGEWTKPLREVEWEGPEDGPYRRLSFSEVPNNTMPLPPVDLWFDLHTLANSVFRKLGRQVDRQKTVLGVRSGNANDGEKIVNANDGDAIVLENPDSSREFKFGGADAPSLAFMLQLKDLVSYHAGNLDVLGGLSPQAPTLGQEELLSQSASKRMEKMQSKVHAFVNRVVRGLAWYLWTDPLVNLPLTKRVPGTSINLPFRYTPERREGDFMDYNLSIEAYSMQGQTPAQKLQLIGNIWSNFIAPYVPVLAEQGIQVNWTALLRKIAEYSNTPELEEFLTFAEPPAMPGPVGTPERASAMSRPAVTRRENVRINRPGATRGGKDGALMQLLLGGGVQPKEAAAIGRPTG